MIDKDTIKPKVRGQSDFFSWQLFRWIRKNPSHCQIWKTETGVLVIGYQHDDDDSISGTYLRPLCHFDRNLLVYSFCLFNYSKWEDVTDWFWKEYMRIGVCAIHGDNAHDWETGGTLRACRHCDKTERQITEMVKRKSWVSVDSELVPQAPILFKTNESLRREPLIGTREVFEMFFLDRFSQDYVYHHDSDKNPKDFNEWLNEGLEVASESDIREYEQVTIEDIPRD